MSNEHFILVNKSFKIDEKVNAVVDPLSDKISGDELIDVLDVDSYEGELGNVSRIEVSKDKAYFFSEDGKLLFISLYSITPGENNTPPNYREDTERVLKNCGVSDLLRRAIVHNLSYGVSVCILTRRKGDIEFIDTTSKALFQNSSEDNIKEWRSLIKI